MKTSVTTGLKLTYVNPSTGETEEIYAEKTVPIENYSDEWYQQRDVNRVLNLVSSTYRGNYTTSYAVKNDYKAYEKETWVNAKGYSSNSNYLVWINRAYQHVNVFTGSKGSWKLTKSFVVGTGAPGTETPVGSHQSHLQAQGRLDHEHVYRSSGRGLLPRHRLCVPFPSVHAEDGQGIRLQQRLPCIARLRPYAEERHQLDLRQRADRFDRRNLLKSKTKPHRCAVGFFGRFFTYCRPCCLPRRRWREQTDKR